MTHIYVIRNPLYRWIIFAICVQAVRSQCSGSALTLTAAPEPAKFTSPGYPTSYANDLTCQWLIDSGTAGQRVLIYSDHYDLDCPLGDRINIYDGSTTSDTLLATGLCGANLQSNDYVSSNRYILVTFTSDSSQVGQGLQFTYLSAPDTSGTGCSAEYALAASTTSQYLTSASFPSLYTSNMACRWLITAPNNSSFIEIELTFTDIETDANCAYDKLLVYYGSYICENQVMLTDCTARTSADATPVRYNSTTNSVLILFNSDISTEHRGFVIKYTEYTIPTTTVSPTTTTAASVLVGSTSTKTEAEVSIPLMVASAVGGACFVLLIIVMVWMVKMLKSKKRSKKGSIMVQAIAPLPSRPARPTLFTPRQNSTTNMLSFV